MGRYWYLFIIIFFFFSCKKDEDKTTCYDSGQICCGPYLGGTRCYDYRSPPIFPQEKTFNLSLKWGQYDEANIWYELNDTISITDYSITGQINFSTPNIYKLIITGSAVLIMNPDDPGRNDTINIVVNETGTIINYNTEEIITTTSFPHEYVTNFTLESDDGIYRHSGSAYELGTRIYEEVQLSELCYLNLCFDLATEGYDNVYYY